MTEGEPAERPRRSIGFHTVPAGTSATLEADEPAEAADPTEAEDAEGAEGAGGGPAAVDGRRAPLLPADVRILDLAIAGVAALLLIANGPRLARGSPVLLAALTWPLGAAGMVGLVLLAWRRDRTAWWGLGYLAWAGVAVVASEQPRISWYAGYGADRGWVYLASYFGLWALARRRGSGLVPLLTAALVFGLGLNMLLGLGQVLTGDGTGLIAAPDGRAMGFPLNAVFLGGLMAGAMALCAAGVGRSPNRWRWWLAGLIAATVTVNLSGSRAALAGGGLLAVVAAWRGGPKRVVLVGVAVVLGVLLAIPLQSGSVSSTGRISETTSESGGLQARTTMWRAGAHAAAEQPITGWGPNRFRPATNSRVTPAFVRSEGPERLFFDAHNIVIEHLVTVGVPGLILLLGFGISVGRRARGPLAWYGAGVAITWLLEPAAVSTVPTAMLALGAAAIRSPVPDPPLADRRARVAFRTATIALVAVAIAAGIQLVWVDHLVYPEANGVPSVDAARRAQRLFPHDPAIADLVTQSLDARSSLIPTAANLRATRDAAAAAIRTDPTWTHLWSNLGLVEENSAIVARNDRLRSTRAARVQAHPDWFALKVDLAQTWEKARPLAGAERFDRARAAFARAQALSPYSVTALTNLHAIDVQTGQLRDAEVWRRKLCSISKEYCPPPAAD